MKKSILFFALLFSAGLVAGQTVENIRVVQDGENLKINYRIGASTESQLYNVFLTCSMDGGRRFEPKAVIGDVGQNIIGGRSYYTIVWDVFADVDEVVNPEFFVRVELVSDMAGEEEPVEQPVETRPAQQQPPPSSTERQTSEPANTQERPFEPDFKVEEEQAEKIPSNRNGFLSYSGMSGYGFPVGMSFGNLNEWGYYMTLLRMGFYFYETEYFDNTWGWVTEDQLDFHFMVSGGVTRHLTGTGNFRSHLYGGVGFHVAGRNLYDDEPLVSTHLMPEIGGITVLGPFNITLGLAFSLGYQYVTTFTFGGGFVF